MTGVVVVNVGLAMMLTGMAGLGMGWRGALATLAFLVVVYVVALSL